MRSSEKENPVSEKPLPVELVREIIDRLARERQQLRVAHADGATLEANRLAIVYWQQRLSHALVAESGRAVHSAPAVGSIEP